MMESLVRDMGEGYDFDPESPEFPARKSVVRRAFFKMTPEMCHCRVLLANASR